jgi:hypothetical protein
MPYLRLPDGSYMDVPDGVSQREALAHAKEKYSDLYKPVEKPDTGLTGAAKASYQTLKGDIAALAGKTGLMDIAEAEKYQKERQAEAQRIFKPTEEGWTEAPFLKARELIGGSLPYMAAPIAVGGAAALGGAPVAAGAGLAGLASGLQFTGSNLSRQMDTGKALKDTDLMAAGAAAVPQAALDVVGFRFLPGVQKIFKSAGVELSEQAAKKVIEAGTLKTVGQYVAGGTKIAGIEGATEAGQQFFERLQAGLNITDPEARKEYLESFIGGAVLGGVASPFGVAGKRGEAKDVVAKAQFKRDEEAAKLAEEQQLADTQAKKDAELQAVEERKAKIEKMGPELYQAKPDLLKKLEELNTQAQTVTDLDELATLSQQAQDVKSQIDNLDPDLVNANLKKLKKENDTLKGQIKKAEKDGNEDLRTELSAKYDENAAAIEEKALRLEALKYKPFVPPNVQKIEKDLAAAQKQLQKAKEQGDLVSIGRIVTKIKEYQSIPEYQQYVAEQQRVAEERSKRAATSADILAQEEQANLANTEIASSRGKPVVQKKFVDLPRLQRHYNSSVEQLNAKLAEGYGEDQGLGPAAPLEIPEGQSAQETLAMVQQKFPEAFMSPEERKNANINLPPADPEVQKLIKKVQDAKDMLEEHRPATYSKADLAPDYAQMLVDKFTAPEQKLPTELTPEQKKAESERLSKLVGLKKDYYDSFDAYKKIIDESEAASQNKGKGKRLYGYKGRPLRASEKAIEAFNKYVDAKNAYLQVMSEGTPTPANAIKGLEAAQDVALLDLTDTIDSMRKGEFFGGPNPAAASGFLGSLAQKARTELDKYKEATLSQINYVRQGKGLPALTEEAKVEIDGQLEGLLAGKIERATGKLARVLKAGEKTAPEDTALRAAFEKAGFKFAPIPTGEKEILTGFSREELADVKDFVNKIKDKALQKERTFGKLTRESTGDLFTEGRIKNTGKARKTDVEIDDAEKAVRGVAAILNTDLSSKDRATFEEAERLLKQGVKTRDTTDYSASGVAKVMPGLVDAVNEQAYRASLGREVEAKETQQAIGRVKEAFASPVQTGPKGKTTTQLEFFPGETATIRADEKNLSRLGQIRNARGADAIAAGRKYFAEKDTGAFRPAAMLKYFESAELSKLIQNAQELQAEGKKYANKTKTLKRQSTKDKYQSMADEAFGMYDETMKEVDEYVDFIEEYARNAIAKADKPASFIAAFEAQKQAVVKELAGVTKETATAASVANKVKKDLARKKEAVLNSVIKDTKERIAKEQTIALQQTGLGLPGTRTQFKTLPRMEAELPNRFPTIQSKFAFARQYYKEMLAARSMTMNTKQREALADKRQKYESAVASLDRAFKQNNVDSRIATVMRNMITMEEGTPQYRKAENLILGIEERIQQGVAGLKPKRETVLTKEAAVEEESRKEALGYTPYEKVKPSGPAPTADEKAVGRITETELAKLRSEKQKRFEFVTKRLADQKAPVEDRAALVDEQAAIEADIKAFDEVLNARRIGMVVGQAQEEKGAKKYKATATEKEMEKAGKFEKAGVHPESYSLVAKAYKDTTAAKKQREEKKTPSAVSKLIKEIAALQVEIQYPDTPLTVGQIASKMALIADKKTQIERATLEFTEELEAKKMGISVDDYRRIFNFMGAGEFKFDADISLTEEQLKKVNAEKRRESDVDFRVGNGKSVGLQMLRADAKAVVDKIKLPKGLDITVIQELSPMVKEYIRTRGVDPESVKGFVTNNGSVVIVAGKHINAKDVEATVAHEVVGHLGVEQTLGKAGMDKLVQHITAQKGGVMGLASKLGVWNEAYGAYAAALRSGKTKEEAQADAVHEMIAHVEEKRPSKTNIQAFKDFVKAMVGVLRAALRKFNIDLDIDTNDIYKILRDARKNFDAVAPGLYKKENGEMQFNSTPAVFGPGGEVFQRAADALMVKQRPLKDRFFPTNIGLTIEQKFIKASAGLMRVYENKGLSKTADALQTQYYIQNHNQRFAWTSQATARGVPILRKEEGGKGFVLESKEGPSLKKLAEILGKANWGNAEGVRNAYSLYRISKRAKRVGLSKLGFKKEEVTDKMLKDVDAAVAANKQLADAFKEADVVYDQYNKNLMNLLVQTGRMSEKVADELTKYNDYIPFYRQEANGDVYLEIGGAPRIQVGNLKDQPYLNELVGSDERIVDIYQGALQNTNMVMDMALRNLATRNTAYSLGKMGFLEKGKNKDGIGIRKGFGETKNNVIRFYVQPIDEKDDGKRHVILKEDVAGVPAQFIIEGLAGVNTSVPTLISMMGAPARLLRSWVTRSPVYAARQVVRDPFIAVMANGVDVGGALKSFKIMGQAITGKPVEDEIGRLGLIGSNVFTGTNEDAQKIMLQITSGKKGWESFLAKADMLALQGDAATRTASFNNFRKQGLSEMEAIIATYELMPFTQRGTSSSLYLLSTMVPFMNAQIQGLNVLYKAFTGKSTFQEKLKIKEKLWQRGMLLFGMSMAYALLMSEDEAYQNANDDERLNNWFVYVPGIDEPVRVPIPFELGIVFKALPETIVNVARGDRTAAEAIKGLGKMVGNAAPIGPSSIPQAVKAPFEVMMDYSFFTQRSIVGDRLKDVDPSERFNANTSEIAKFIGKGTGQIPILGEYLSPVQIEYLVRGYTGSLPLAVASLTNPLFGSEAGEKPTARASDLPVVGSLFQPKDAGGLINRAYKDMESVNKAKGTYNKMIDEGRDKEADAYADRFADLLDLAPLAGDFRSRMGQLAKEEREIKADPNLSGPEKRRQLDEIRQERIERAKDFISARE